MTIVTRRSLLAGLSATALLPVLPRPARAFALGGAQIDMLSDGYLGLPAGDLLAGLAPADAEALRAEFDLGGDMVQSPLNITLLRDGARTVLFDIGSGPDFMATAGDLLDALQALGVDPGEITDLVLTHAHPDHLWGLLDDFDEPNLPNAQIHMGRAEFDYWMDPDTANTIGEARLAFAAGARRRLDAVADMIRFLDDGDEVLPGVEALLSPGHTPGHMGYVIHHDGGLMVLGDAITNPHVHLHHPAHPTGMDQDPQTAGATRARLLERITADGLMVAGYHLPGGGLGAVERRAAGGYSFVQG